MPCETANDLAVDQADVIAELEHALAYAREHGSDGVAISLLTGERIDSSCAGSRTPRNQLLCLEQTLREDCPCAECTARTQVVLADMAGVVFDGNTPQ